MKSSLTYELGMTVQLGIYDKYLLFAYLVVREC